MNSLLRVEHVTISYNGKPMVEDVSFEVKQGEILGIVGESGSGKSTIIKAIMGLLGEEGLVTRGDIWYKGENLTDMSEKKLRKLLGTEIGMVFQKPNPFPMSIYDNVAFGPRTHGIRSKVKLDEIVERSLRDAALWDEVKDRLKTSALGMSGGQQQRLCIARALAVQPKVILCDESTASLDPISTGKIEDLLMELKSKYTVIMVTHNMQQAVRISDCCAFFLMGELIEFNWTDTLFSTPQNKKTEDYITGRFG